MQHRIFCFSAACGAALLAMALSGCNTPPSDSGTPPFVPTDGATDPAALTPGSAQLASSTIPRDSLDLAYLISPGRAGQLRLGMRESQLKKLIPASRLRATTYLDNGRQLPAYELRDARQPTASPTILHLIGDSANGFRLRRIRIYDPQYRTAEGIGVGSPFGAARQNLGLTKVRDTPAGFAAVSGEVKIAWVVDPNSLPNKHPQEMNSTDIPPAARITAVLLYQ